jgi:hypothetical protein
VRLPRAFESGVIEDAFHGTDADLVHSIRTGGFHGGPRSLYGAGTYFFEGDYHAACWWAKNHAGARCPVVLRARVRLGRTLYLNLLKKQIEVLQVQLARRLGKEVTEAQAYAVLRAGLARQGLVDSLKAVRAIPKKESYKEDLRAEVIVVVWDPTRAEILEELRPEDLGSESSMAV